MDMEVSARRRRIGVIGGRAAAAEVLESAERIGRLLGEAGTIVVCGGRGGVMEAACRGARRAGGLTLGILPGSDDTDANPWVDVAIPTGLGAARNVLVALASEAVIALDGRYGTLMEIACALTHGRPVIGLGTWRAAPEGGGGPDPITRVATPEAAVDAALSAIRRG